MTKSTFQIITAAGPFGKPFSSSKDARIIASALSKKERRSDVNILEVDPDGTRVLFTNPSEDTCVRFMSVEDMISRKMPNGIFGPWIVIVLFFMAIIVAGAIL